MRTIKKAKLNSVGYMEIEYEQKINTEDGETFTFENSQKCTWSPHNDLLVILDELKPHLAILCEQADSEIWDTDNHPILSKLKVTGFTIGGHDEHEGVTLIGRRQLTNNRVLNLISPFTKWEDEHNPYVDSYELAAVIRRLQEEVSQYLDGKMAPNMQLSLDFQGN